MRFDRIFAHTAARGSDIVQRFRVAFPHAQLVPVLAESEVRKHLNGASKHVVYIGPRSSSFVSRFHPLEGVVCAPFWKFTAETSCPMGCHYCYLNLTLRIIPYVRVASNLDKGLGEMERVLYQEAKRGRRVMFNIGELADGRILNPITHLSRHFLPVLNRHPNGMLHVLTKAGSNTIGNYLDSAHLAQGRVIHVASINPQSVLSLTEEDTPPVADRLAALGELQRAGYRIRLRIDPIFDLRDFGCGEEEAYKAYDELVDQIRATITPELVTLGSYRAHPQLMPHIRRCYPNSPVLEVRTRQEGNKKRTVGRETFYRRIIDQLRAVFSQVHIALCKEPTKVWERTGLEMKPLQCSCLPFAREIPCEICRSPESGFIGSNFVCSS